jgi:hypothetical protein
VLPCDESSQNGIPPVEHADSSRPMALSAFMQFRLPRSRQPLAPGRVRVVDHPRENRPTIALSSA